MGTTPNRGYPYAEPTTAPPDAAGWDKQGLLAVDADMVKTLGAVSAINARILFGPVSQVPASLAPGVVYLGY